MTDADREVLGLIFQGKTDAEIVHITGQPEHRVKRSVKALLDEFGARNRTGACYAALKRGILDLPK